MNTYRYPSKTFLIGEYLALNGGPSLVACTPPYFSISVGAQGKHGIHPDSPAGKYIQAQSTLSDKIIQVDDPHHGKGGFGASTAQFAAVYAACHSEIDNSALLQTYKQFASFCGKVPSGHDILAQVSDGLCVIEGDAVTRVRWPFADLDFRLLRTGNKVATHHHLKELQQANFQSLKPTAESAITALGREQKGAFLDAINTYQKQLASLNLSHIETVKIIEKLQQKSSVLAAKGCGALGADVIALFCHPDTFSGIDDKITDLDTIWPQL